MENYQRKFYSEKMTLNGTPQAQLKNARNLLLKHHKTLLEQQRAGFERDRGPINSTGEYLNLVMTDEWFAWLRVLSGLIVQIDEAFDVKDPPMSEETALLLGAQTRNLLKPKIADSHFSTNYERALLESANAAAEHREIIKRLEDLLGKEV